MSYLKKRHNTWYARMGIPELARPILGRNEFVKSLQTSSKSIAEHRAILFVTDWKEQVASAISDDRLKQEALWWRTTYHESTSL